MVTKILSLNCQGLGGLEKRRDVFNYIKAKNSTVYCLQDIHSTSSTEQLIRTQWGFEGIFSSGNSKSRGVAILFHYGTDFKLHNHITDSNGNFIVADISLDNNRLTLVNLYGPNDDSPAFYEHIMNQVDAFGNDYVVMCGDFNLVQDPDKDYYNYKHINNRKAHKKILEIKENYNLFDPFREIYPDLKRYTWRRKRPIQQARLDFFLISESLLASVEKCCIEESYRSDHSIILLNLKFNQFEKGKPLWKHNNSLLKDKQYLECIKYKIEQIKEQYALPVYSLEYLKYAPNHQLQFTINDQLFLETLLMELRGKSISYSSYKAKERNSKEKEAINKIKSIENKLNQDNVNELAGLNATLAEIRKEKMQGVLIRSRANIIENDEKPSAYFCKLESYKFASKIIPKVQKDNGQIITNQHEILDEAKKYYETLYSARTLDSDNIDLKEELNNCSYTTLNREESRSLDGSLTLTELTKSLKNMSNNRSPGSDGFTPEFFKVFWKQLGDFILRSVNYGFQKGELSITQREGIITCIPKENKPRQFLKNYRPISLLNCVYKITSGAIANRLKGVLDKLIHEDQTGFMSGRYMGQNTRLIYDVMHYAEENNIPGLILLVDFEKAFDSISWSFIQKVLKTFSFGDSFIKWVNILNKNARLAVNQGGNLSEFFSIGRGCRQGDPISAYIFLLCAEILAIKIRSNINIKGIQIDGIEYKLSQYADDLSTLLDGSPQSLNETLNELYAFAQYSGLKVNYDKTHVIWIGSKKYSQDSIKTKWKLSWGVQKFKLLGLNFDVDLSKMITSNYTEKIQQIKNHIINWKRRYLTPLGKITVIKTLLLPILNHLFISLPNPASEMIKEINKIFYDFIWKGTAKIKQSVLIKQYCEGGLQMVNLEAFMKGLKATWFRRTIQGYGKWFKVIENSVQLQNLFNLGSEYINMCANKVSNPFWKDALMSLYDISRAYKPENNAQVMSTPIFYNSNIQIGGKSYFHKSSYNRGIAFINDLLTPEGSFLSYQSYCSIYNTHIDFVQYYGLIEATKKCLSSFNLDRTSITRIQNPIMPIHVSILLKQSKGSKHLYTILNKNETKPTALGRWNEVYHLTDKDWEAIYALPFRYDISSELRWLQSKINHRILQTRKYLYNIKIESSPNCLFCREIETIQHMLWSCAETSSFLIQVNRLLGLEHHTIDLNETSYLFNINRKFSQADIIVLLETKYFIFVNKVCKRPLSIIHYKKRLCSVYKTLRFMASRDGNIDTFNNLWSKYSHTIEQLMT